MILAPYSRWSDTHLSDGLVCVCMCVGGGGGDFMYHLSQLFPPSFTFSSYPHLDSTSFLRLYLCYFGNGIFFRFVFVILSFNLLIYVHILIVLLCMWPQLIAWHLTPDFNV